MTVTAFRHHRLGVFDGSPWRSVVAGLSMSAAVWTGAAAQGSASTEGLARKSQRDEHFANAVATYRTLTVRDGTRLRLIVTEPKARIDKRPLLFFVGWLSCDSFEAPDDSRWAISQLVHRLADDSRAITVRLDKRGVGDSDGNCAETDFETELGDYREAYRWAVALPGVETSRIIVVGLSNGGGFAPLVPAGPLPSAYLVEGGWYRTWYDHMLENERQRLRIERVDAATVERDMAPFSRFYQAYLIDGTTPAAVLAAHSDLKSVWTEDDLRHQYGRPVAYYQQLNKLQLTAAWREVSVPVLLLHGELDVVMGGADPERLAALLNGKRPGSASFHEVPGMTHDLGQADSLADAAAGRERGLSPRALQLIEDWLRVEAR
jgi:pimeloyl-ACP methyl ester carboxylesterase